jgi:hypothetical protein
MEIKLTKETLAGKKLFVGTPMYGGQCMGMYMKSCLDLQAICMQYGVEVKFSFLFNESLVNRARCYISDEFLRSDCTHLMFIDADVGFNAIDVLAMLAMDKEIGGAPYPKKSINWNNIKKAIVKNPKINSSELEKLGGDIVFNPAHGTTSFNVSEPLEVMEVGTGMMMIRREVFDKFKVAYPEYDYLPDHVGTANFGGDRSIHAYFSIEIDPVSKRLWSEDYFFTQKCRAIGIKVWMYPFINCTHTGTYTFQGNLASVANHLGEI